MTKDDDDWGAVQLGQDGISLVQGDQLRAISAWLVALAENTSAGQLPTIYPGFFYTTNTQVSASHIHSYVLIFFRWML